MRATSLNHRNMTSMPPHILVVDNDEDILSLTRGFLSETCPSGDRRCQLHGSVTSGTRSARLTARGHPSEDCRWRRRRGLIAMDCVGCGPGAVSERSDRTAQGYRRSGAGTAANSSTSAATVSSIEHRCRATSTRSWCSVGQSGYQSWYDDETYLKVEGLWCYLY
jgi:hypothetical protein